MMVRLRGDFPNFAVKVRQIEKKSNKVAYKGLTIARMQAYITEFHKDKVEDFKQYRLWAEHHNGKYALIKKWFLDNFEDYKVYEIRKNESEKRGALVNMPDNSAVKAG